MGWVDGEADDGGGVALGDLFNGLPAFGGGDHDGGAEGVVDEDGGVVLVRDGGLLLNEEAPDLAALGSGLMGDEVVAEDLLRRRRSLGRGVDETDAADGAAFDAAFIGGGIRFELGVHGGGLVRLGDEAALAAPAGVDLGLDNGLTAEVPGGFFGLLDGRDGGALGNGDAVLGEDRLRLEFVDLHASDFLFTIGTARAGLDWPGPGGRYRHGMRAARSG